MKLFAASTLAFLFTLPTYASEEPVPVPPILDATALKDGADGRGTVDPCENFYEFACGAWLDRTVIPPDKSAVARNYTASSDNIDIKLNQILEAYSKGDISLSSSAAKKLGDYYQSCLNVEKLSPKAIQEAKERSTGIRSTGAGAARASLVARLHLEGAGPFFGFGSAQDLDDSTKVIGDLGQGGIALGQRDYYFPTDDKGRDILAKYEAHVAKMLTLLGQSPESAKRAAASIVHFETELARASYTLADQNDPSKTHHPVNLKELKRLAPHFDWAAYFKAIGNSYVSHMNVDEPEFFQGLDKLLAATPKQELDNYLVWQFLHSIASALGGDFDKENFAFWNAYLNGAKSQKPLWKRCTIAAESQLGYALAEAYVQTFDGKAIKAKTERLIADVRGAFGTELRTLTDPPEGWMDKETLTQALAKVAAISQKVGGPVKWRDYSSLLASRRSYLDNVIHATRFESNRDVAKIGKPVDRFEWFMMPWEINAYYDRSKNEFVFPFGILQPPSLDLSASDGANLGAFGGATIGHELTHGFDNNGSQYDAKGNVHNWWSPNTLKQFQKKTSCFADQASAFEIKEVGLHVNGKNTLEENLADQGGVKLGYGVLSKSLESRPEAAVWDKKYTERQQFWIAYAQSWCTKMTNETLRQSMTIDVHPPAEFRVNAVVMNRPEFAKDFQCSSRSKLASTPRCSIW
jgi:endothelin-converting enzyme/putative endopeptidase